MCSTRSTFNFRSGGTAILIADPQRVGLKGGPRQEVSCHLPVANSDGELEVVPVERIFVQIFDGDAVKQVFAGN